MCTSVRAGEQEWRSARTVAWTKPLLISGSSIFRHLVLSVKHIQSCLNKDSYIFSCVQNQAFIDFGTGRYGKKLGKGSYWTSERLVINKTHLLQLPYVAEDKPSCKYQQICKMSRREMRFRRVNGNRLNLHCLISFLLQQKLGIDWYVMNIQSSTL